MNPTPTPYIGRCVPGRWLAVLTTIVVGLLTVQPAAAHADSPQPDGPPNKGRHSWCYKSGFRQQATADAAMTWLRNQTVVQTLYPGSCRTHTDVRWDQGPLPRGAYGRAECKKRQGSGYCDRYLAELNMGAINNAPRPNEQRRKTACHELGHTVGVRHYSGTNLPGNDRAHSCLRSGTVRASWTNLRKYGHHHRTQHINPWFG